MAVLAALVADVVAAEAAVAAAEVARVRALAAIGQFAVDAARSERASVRASEMAMREVASEVAAASRACRSHPATARTRPRPASCYRSTRDGATPWAAPTERPHSGAMSSPRVSGGEDSSRDGVTKVADGVIKITRAVTNCYLVDTDDGVLPIDAGLPRSWPLVLDALRSRGLSADDIASVYLTHGHFDHVGLAERLQEDHHVPIHVNAADVPLARHQ